MTWTDLGPRPATEAAKRDRSKDLADLRARSLYQIARTYGIPNPPDDTQLNLGVAALRRFLADATRRTPGPSAPRIEIGAVVPQPGPGRGGHRGVPTPSSRATAIKAETDEARRDLGRPGDDRDVPGRPDPPGPGEVRRGDRRLAGLPGQVPQRPAVGRRPAGDPRHAAPDRRRRPRAARSTPRPAPPGRPSSPRTRSTPGCPQVLFQVGESFEAEKKFDEAIAAWEPLVGKFPGSEPAAHAQFEVASIFEDEKGDPAAAIERFRKVAAEPWKSQADQRIAVMESKALTVVTPRAFRSGETAHLKITTRNLETLTFTAYKLNAEAYFRKKHVLGGVESLDVGLVAARRRVDRAGPGLRASTSRSSRPMTSRSQCPGVYVVKVTDEKTPPGDDAGRRQRPRRDRQGLARAGARLRPGHEDGQGPHGGPRAGRRRPGVILEKTTGDDGVLLDELGQAARRRTRGAPLPRPRRRRRRRLGPRRARQGGAGADAPGLHLHRPARLSARPGGRAPRGRPRGRRTASTPTRPGESYRLEVFDSPGPAARSPGRSTLSEFGTFHEAIRLDPAAPVGTYRVRLFQPGKSEFAGQFEVQSYQLEKIDLAFDLPEDGLLPGRDGQGRRRSPGTSTARRSPGRPIEVALPDGRIVQGTTDAAGKFHVEFPTEGFAEEQALRIVARLPRDNVAAVAERDAGDPGVPDRPEHDPRRLPRRRDVPARRRPPLDAQGKPTGQELRVAVLKQVNQGGPDHRARGLRPGPSRPTRRPARGRSRSRSRTSTAGAYVVRVAGTDRFGNPIVADRRLDDLGQGGRDPAPAPGRPPVVQGRRDGDGQPPQPRPGRARRSLAWEADRILQYRSCRLKEGDNPLTWAVDGAAVPQLHADRRADGRRPVRRGAAGRPRRARPARRRSSRRRPAVGPGEEVEVEVDDRRPARPAGRRPRSSLALVDRSLLRLFADKLPPIGPFFYDQTRTGAFATEATNTFRYEPATTARLRGRRRGGRAARAPRLATTPAEAPCMDEAQSGAEARCQACRGRTPPRHRACRGRSHGRRRWPAPAGQASSAAACDVGGRIGELGGWASAARRDGSAAGRRRRGETARSARTNVAEHAADRRRRGLGSARASTGRSLADAASAGRRRSGRTAAEPRERFVETAYWNPAVVTGKDGKATRQVQGPDGPLGVPLHGPGRHRRRHPGRPGDGRPGRPQGLLRRPQGPRRARPRATSPGSRRRSTTSGVKGHGRASGWRSTRASASRSIPKTLDAEGRRRRGGPLRAVRGPRRRVASG